jgi:hypothetical protein
MIRDKLVEMGPENRENENDSSCKSIIHRMIDKENLI